MTVSFHENDFQPGKILKFGNWKLVSLSPFQIVDQHYVFGISPKQRSSPSKNGPRLLHNAFTSGCPLGRSVLLTQRYSGWSKWRPRTRIDSTTATICIIEYHIEVFHRVRARPLSIVNGRGAHRAHIFIIGSFFFYRILLAHSVEMPTMVVIRAYFQSAVSRHTGCFSERRLECSCKYYDAHGKRDYPVLPTPMKFI